MGFGRISFLFRSLLAFVQQDACGVCGYFHQGLSGARKREHDTSSSISQIRESVLSMDPPEHIASREEEAHRNLVANLWRGNPRKRALALGMNSLRFFWLSMRVTRTFDEPPESLVFGSDLDSGKPQQALPKSVRNCRLLCQAS